MYGLFRLWEGLGWGLDWMLRRWDQRVHTKTVSFYVAIMHNRKQGMTASNLYRGYWKIRNPTLRRIITLIRGTCQKRSRCPCSSISLYSAMYCLGNLSVTTTVDPRQRLLLVLVQLNKSERDNSKFSLNVMCSKRGHQNEHYLERMHLYYSGRSFPSLNPGSEPVEQVEMDLLWRPC